MPSGSADVKQPSRKLSALVWIEDDTARISRGEAETVTSEGLQVKLAEAPGFGQGDEVAVRISFQRGAATIAVTARVAWVRGAAGQVECGLQWSTPPGERRDLEAWLAKAA
jgi:hypothetical protein